jgi:hypothetical protein
MSARHLADLEPRARAQELAEALASRGLPATVLRNGGHELHPCVLIARGRDGGPECVYAAPEDGQWWFWWYSLERIAPISEVATAAEEVTRVLGCGGQPGQETAS